MPDPARPYIPDLPPTIPTDAIRIPAWLVHRDGVLWPAKALYGRLLGLIDSTGQRVIHIDRWRLAKSLGLNDMGTRQAADALRAKHLIDHEMLGHGRPDRFQLLDHPWMHDHEAHDDEEDW